MEPLIKKVETDMRKKRAKKLFFRRKINLFYYIIMILISIDAKILIRKYGDYL
jgi:hypothetical protein